MTSAGHAAQWSTGRSNAVRSGATLKTVAGGSVAALVAMEVWAALTGYGLRVTSDTPTFLPIVRDLAIHPLRPVSPFLNDPHIASSHGSPYWQVVALLWNAVAPSHDASGAPSVDPRGLYTFLALFGIGTTLLLLHAVFVWVRSQAGSRAALASVPVLLVLFGPANIIWAGDTTFHGFLYGAFFPQNAALAFLLYALTVLERPLGVRPTAIAAVCVALTFTIHPFTGALLAALVAAKGCGHAVRRRRDWIGGSVATMAGFSLGLLWPAYSLNGALVDAGLKGWVFVAACSLAPVLARAFERPERMLAMARRMAIAVELPGRTRTWSTTALAMLGLGVVGALALWEALLVHAGSPDPLVHANRLAVYWVEDRWRWPLMLGGGAVGVLGLVRLARRNRVVPACWVAGCFTVGTLGALGFAVPVWYRFVLLAQVPLALGVAIFLVTIDRRTVARRAASLGLAVLLLVKLATLFVLPQQLTYFGTDLQSAYSLTGIIPRAPGLVATDPFTAYYVPGSTGHRVLSVTKSHVNSSYELADSERGYVLLHRFYAGTGWWAAARTMYRKGVRYVLVDKQTSLAPPTLADFSTGPTPLIRTAADRRQLSRYFYRCNRVGRLLYDSETYVVFHLDASKLWKAT